MGAAKLVPPSAPASVVARTALLERLDEGFSRRLTTVVAGAGFGKSTLLAAWAQRVPCAWYGLDSADTDTTTFARGLLASLRRAVPDLPTELDAAVGAGLGPDASGPARADAVAAALSEALHAGIDGPLLIVLEDLHELAGHDDSARLVAALGRQTPAEVHLAVTSRAPVPFAIQRWRGRGEVLELDSSALAFSPAETRDAVRLALKDDAPELAQAVHRFTGGWPAAVRLTVEALRHRPATERADALAAVTERGGPLMNYLIDEVLAGEAAEVRELLWRMAPLERVPAALCEHLGAVGAEQILTELQRRGLVIARSGEAGQPWYELQALVRQGVAATAPLEVASGGVAQRAAEWFAARGDTADALRCLMAAGDDTAIAALLEAHGGELVAGGEIRLAAAAAGGLPPRLRSAQIEMVEGEARQVLGEWDQALERFTAAGGDRESLDPGLAWRMGLIHHLRGDARTALEVYQRGVADPDRPRDTALLHAWTAAAHWLCGEVGESRKAADAALELAAGCADDDALAAAHTALAMLAAHDGDRRENDRCYQLALEAATRSGNVLQRIRIHSNRGSRAFEQGDYAEAEQQLEPAIRLAELTGHTVLHGLALANRGDARLCAGRLEEATADLRSARAILERVGSSLVVYPVRGLGDAYAVRGELMLARAAYEDAAALAERTGDLQGLAPALAGQARVIAAEDPAAARALAQRALDSALGVQRAAALLAVGWAALAAGDAPEARACADAAAVEARTRWDRAALAQSLELSAAAGEPHEASALLDEARAVWVELGNPIGQARAELGRARLATEIADRLRAEAALNRLRELGVRGGVGSPPAPLQHEVPARMDLVVRSLGGFRVLRAGQPIPAAAWQSRKARDLLKVLVARRGRPVPREVVMDLLWPGEDPERLGNRLSVALSTLRAVLDPERRFDPDRFVTADRTAIALADDTLDIDVERFLALAADGLAQRDVDSVRARDLLIAAEAAYTGDFLEEDQYEEWAAPLREEARAAYLAVTRALAESAEAAGRHDVAVRCWLRLLERDPYDEHAHLSLVGGLAGAGRHGEAHRYYQDYGTRMLEIGVEALPYPTRR